MKSQGVLLFFGLLTACGSSVDLAFEETAPVASVAPGSTEPAARLIFHRDHFTNLEDFVNFQNTRFKCLGDITKVHRTTGGDYSASFTPLWNPPAAVPFAISDSADDLGPTYRPSFIKNVSVDITRTYYAETLAGTLQTDVCSKRSELVIIPPSPCADFDPPGAGPLLAPGPPAPVDPPANPPDPTPTPPSTPSDVNGHNFYRVRDPWCTGQGAVESNEPELTKAFVGGVNIDLDRKFIENYEDLLMLITYQSFLPGESWPLQLPLVPGGPYTMGQGDYTRLRVDLIATGRTLDVLMERSQPRMLGDLAEFGGAFAPPLIVKRLVTLEDPYPTLKTESVLVPLSQNGLIDRIRIERVRGSYHLYQIDLYRLGNRPPVNSL